MNANEILVHTRLTRKYMLPAIVMANPYSEDRDGFLYLVSEGEYATALLCDSIVQIEVP